MDGITPKMIGNYAGSINTPAPQAAPQKSESKEPKDKVSLESILKYKKEDVKPDGKVGVIFKADNPEKLAELKERIAENPNNRIKVDLPLISGFAAEIDPNTNSSILSDLTKSTGDIRAFLDGKIGIIDPVDQKDLDAGIMMDVAGRAMGVDKMWDQGFKGQGKTICVIDTGIAQHPDYKNRIVGFKDFVNGKDGVENAYDDQGHGTHCAGIAVGDGTASEGKYTGVAPEANVVGVKVLNKWGSGSFSDIIAGIQWAVENKDKFGIDVISLSLGGGVSQSYKDDPVAQAVEKSVDKGIITVVAAGNSGPSGGTIGTPAHAPSAFTIGALDDRGTVDPSDDRIASFSSRGPTRVDNLPKPDILTPGVNITAPRHTGGYTSMSGTSMACPMAAGLTALTKQAVPNAGPNEIKAAVMATASPIDGLSHNDQGAGVFDINKAVDKLNTQQA